MMLTVVGRRLVGRSRRGRRAIPHAGWFAATATACGFAVGMLAEYFLDPRGGRRRRHEARDRGFARMRRAKRGALTSARRAESRAVGVARRTVNARRRHREPFDDVTLTHKVESELYRRAGVPKGHLSINAEDGTVFLRGVMDRQEEIDRLEAAARRIAGVRSVENLIHMPGTPAPASRPKVERAQTAGHDDGSRRRARNGS